MGAVAIDTRTAITISRAQRDAIYEEVLNDLGAIGDIGVCLENQNFNQARRYRQDFEDDMRLLDDLGWEPEALDDQFTLGMPRDQLARTLLRLGSKAASFARDQPVETLQDQDYACRAVAIATTCHAVLGQVVESEAS